MAKQTINNTESGLVVRGKINDNFTELYDDVTILASVSSTNYIESLTTSLTSASAVNNIVILSQEEYDSITPDSSTLYYVS
jgi:anthranilate phosphoribosyltransferase